MEINILNKCICLCAKRNSGKSELLRYIYLTNKSLFEKVFVICPSESVNRFYQDIIPKEDIFDTYKEEWIEKLIKKLTEINAGLSDDNAHHILLILDDCCSDTRFHNSNSFKKLFTRGRHIKITLFITTQYLNQIPPIARNNCDYLMVGQLNSQGVELLTKEFMVGSIHRVDFIKLYHLGTSNYGFLVINNNSTKDNSNIDLIYGVLKTPEKYIKNK
jgi:hypothetical protein